MKRLFLPTFLVVCIASTGFALVYEAEAFRIQKKDDLSAADYRTGTATLRALADGRLFAVNADGTTSASLNALNPDIITVSPTGDSTTIAGAITLATARTPSATNRVTILVSPGVYAGRHYLPDYVDLIGVSREGCILKDDMENELLIVLGNSTVANLTVENTHTAVRSATCSVGGNTWLGNPTVSGKVMRVRNCTFISAGKDNYGTFGDNDIVTENCTMISPGIDNLGVTVPAGSTGHVYIDCTVETTVNSSKVLWAAGAGEASFYGCSFQTGGNYGILNLDNVPGSFGTGTVLRFFDCTFLKNGGDDLGTVIGFVNVAEGVTGDVVELNGCHYATTGITGWEAAVEIATEDLGDGAKTFGGPVTVARAFTAANGGVLGGTFSGGKTFSDTTVFSSSIEVGTEETLVDAYFYADLGLGGNSQAFRIKEWQDHVALQWSADGDTFDYEIRPTGVGELGTNKAWRSAGLNTTATQWRYFDAVAEAGGYAYYASAVDAWEPDAFTDAAALVNEQGGDSVYFPAPYEAGTVITRISARWQGGAADDGIILTLQKRQGGKAGAAWATVGAAQTYTGDTETNSVYNLADETMAAGYVYRVMVEAVVASTSAKLWEIGIETSKRAY